MDALLLSFICLFAPPGERTRSPDLLQRVFDLSQQGTSEAEWVLHWSDGLDSGLRERYITRRSESDLWESNRGDELRNHAASYGNAPSLGMSDEEIA